MATIRLTPDFKEFLQLLNDHEVEYLVVGGYAVMYHGYIRTTDDMDIWVGVSKKNAEKLTKVLRAFGFSEDKSTPALFLDEKKVLQFGFPPFRIDVLMSVAGIDFQKSYANRIVDSYDGVNFNILCFDDLLENKKASGRPKDLGDLDYFSKH